MQHYCRNANNLQNNIVILMLTDNKKLQEARQTWLVGVVNNLQLDNPTKEIAEKTSYDYSTVSMYLSKKRFASVNFLQRFCNAYKFDFAEINHMLIDKIKDVLTGDLEQNAIPTGHMYNNGDNNSITGVPSQPPESNVQVFDYENKSINRRYFEEIMPKWDDRKNWLPLVGNFCDLLDVYGTVDNLIKESESNFWPLSIQPQGMMHFGVSSADFIAKAPATLNMMPVILPGANVSVKFTRINEIKWGKPYVIILKDRACEMYFIRRSKTPNYWLCKSLDQNNFDDMDLEIIRVWAVFEIIFPVLSGRH